MATVNFDFLAANSWTMQQACANGTNPAPVTHHPVIYIIHNRRTNGTYVGYANDAYDRWRTRTEVFHCFNFELGYGADILCAWCTPQLNNPPAAPGPYPGPLAGQGRPEHLLIRAVANGLLGATTCTNTALRGSTFVPTGNINQVIVRLPGHGARWGLLERDKMIGLPPGGY